MLLFWLSSWLPDWLILVGLLVSAIATWFIVRSGVLDKLAAKLGKRGFALRTFLIAAVFIVIDTLIVLPYSIYGGWWRGPWSLDAGIGAAVNSYRSRRDLNFGTTRATAEGDYRGRQLSGHLDARHQQRFAVGGPGMLEVGPMAGLQALRLETDSYDETGAGAMNLSVAADTVTSLRSSLGGAVAYPMTLPDGTWLRPELRLRWAHEFADTATVVDAAFAGPGGAAFEVRSDDLDRDSALLGAGLEARLKGGLSLSGAYDLQLQQGYSVQALTARMRLAF